MDAITRNPSVNKLPVDVRSVEARSGVTRWVEGRRRPSTVTLAYHNIMPTHEDVGGDVSLQVDQSTFADQLDCLAPRLAGVGA